VTLDLAHALASLGHRVDLLLLQAEGDFPADAKGYSPVRSPKPSRLSNAVLPLAAHLRRHRPDGLIAMMWPLTVLAPVAARALKRKTRVAVVEHGLRSQTYAYRGGANRAALCASIALGYRPAHARIGVSTGLAANMAEMPALPCAEVQPVINPIRTRGPLDPDALARATSTWRGNGPRIPTVGSLKPAKNHTLLLRALASMANLKARLVILGLGECLGPHRALADDLGLADRVLFPGFHDPAPFYATADLFALSSDREGFGNALVEAMAHGLPVVSTDCPREIVGDGVWARMVTTGDASALARAMEDALASPADPAAPKARATDFAPEIAAKRYLTLIGLS
jgi:glycosyltransferase involved in cell wall biosynthesis